MTSPEDPTQPNEGPERPEDPRPQRPRLTRSSSDRIIAGVAGGLGRHLGIDPILVRIAFVLLTFIGGAGLLAYLALIAFVPADESDQGTSNRTASIWAIAALAVAAVIFLGPPVVFLGPWLLVLGLIAVAVVLVVRGAGGTSDPGRTVARVGLAVLGVLAAAGGAVGVAVAAALGGGVVIATLTVVAGLALIAAAFLGGARWMILPALVLAVPLAVVAAGDISFDGGVGNRSYHPQDVAELRHGYEVGMGRLDVDLRDVDLPAGRTDMKVDVGVGEARIRVADDVCVTTDADIGAGQADIFDRGSGGVDVAFAEGARPDLGQPELHVDANIGVGHLDIARDGFDDYHRGFFRDGFAADRGVNCP